MTETGIHNKAADYSKLVRRMAADNRILATHVSLFTALFVCFQHGGFTSPFAVTRKKLMAYSRIASIATYHKCIKELDAFGYIRYQPSYHPIRGSLSTGRPVDPGSRPRKRCREIPAKFCAPTLPTGGRPGMETAGSKTKLLARHTYALCRERVNVFAIQKPGFTLKGCPGTRSRWSVKKRN